MPNDLGGISAAITQISDDVQDSFGALSAEQLNWKPAPESWSVGQCLDHLIKSNEEFFPELEGIASGTRKNTFWQNWSPLSGIAGAFLVSTLKIHPKIQINIFPAQDSNQYFSATYVKFKNRIPTTSAVGAS